MSDYDNEDDKSTVNENAENKSSIGYAFGLMESHKERLEIQGYSLSQRTLEQIFLSFTRLQKN